jgi:uncharacterized protein
MNQDYNKLNGFNVRDNDLDVINGKEGLGQYLSRVYSWMFSGLLATAVAAFLTAGSQTFLSAILTNPLLFYGIIIAELALVIFLSARIRKISYSTAVSVFIFYSVLNGITLSIVLLAFTMSSVAYTFAITSATFGIMSIYGYVTKTDLSRVRNILFMGLIGLIVLSVVNWFVNASSLSWLISILGLFVFLGLTAYDTQKIKEYYYASEGNNEMYRKSAIMGALKLYLDFINLFLILLRVLGRRR